MAFFPDQVMPKSLKKETSKEVDNSPLIYNARDFNIHHREIRAIQEVLLGTGGGQGSGAAPGDEVTSGGSEDGGMSVSDALNRFTELLNLLATRGGMGMYDGTIQIGSSIILPDSILSTKTDGAISAAASNIDVASTAGFPSSGIITKFNRIDAIELCSDGAAPGGGSSCADGEEKIIGYDGLISGSHATNQEIIAYTGKTSTRFTGCTRGVNGSTAQAATASSPALIVNGRAAISLGHNFWGRGTTGTPNQFYLAHDALLRVTGGLLKEGSKTRTGAELQDHIEISWLLSYVSYFASIDVSQIFTTV